MTVTKNTTHVQDALGNRIEQFKDKQNFADTLTTYVEQVQDIEDVLFEILDETEIGDSVGQQLDNLGDIVGEPRNGRNDADYELAILARIGLNNSRGTIEDVIGLVRSLVGDKNVFVTEFSPAAFEVEVTEDIDVDGELIGNFVASGRPAGVRGIFKWHATGPEFFFDNGPGFDIGELGGAAEA